MQRHLERELKRVNALFNELCDIVEGNFTRLITALEKMDPEYFDQFPLLDHKIDDQEIVIEEECLKILALYQPVAGDLRSIIAVFKINAEIERIGDLTANIASRAKSLSSYNMEAANFLIPDMYNIVKRMLHDSLESFKTRDTNLAIKVHQLDAEVDSLHSRMYQVLRSSFEKNPEKYDAYMNYISISRFLERIADHSTNIAEDLLYMLEGKIFRHQKIESDLPTD